MYDYLVLVRVLLDNLNAALDVSDRKLLVSISDSMDVSLSRLWEMVGNREAWRAAVHGVTKGQIQLRD